MRYVVPISPDDVALVTAQIRDTYTRIMNHEFDKGCGKEECAWCNFAKTHELLKPVQEDTFIEL